MKKVWMQPSVLAIACVLALVATVPAHAIIDDVDASDRLDAAIEHIRIERHGAFIEASPRAADLRLRILFSRKFVEVGNDFRNEDRVGLPELIEAARGSTDPLVLQLLYERCRNVDRRAAQPCDAVLLARRWVETDAQNQMAWIELATAVEQAGDLRGADDAWARAALASTFRDPYFSIARLIVRTLPATADPLTRYADFIFAVGYGAA